MGRWQEEETEFVVSRICSNERKNTLLCDWNDLVGEKMVTQERKGNPAGALILCKRGDGSSVQTGLTSVFPSNGSPVETAGWGHVVVWWLDVSWRRPPLLRKLKQSHRRKLRLGEEVEQVRGGRKDVKLQYGVVGSSLLLVYWIPMPHSERKRTGLTWSLLCPQRRVLFIETAQCSVSNQKRSPTPSPGSGPKPSACTSSHPSNLVHCPEGETRMSPQATLRVDSGSHSLHVTEIPGSKMKEVIQSIYYFRKIKTF